MERTRLLAELAGLLDSDNRDPSGILQGLCAACVQLLPITGAGAMLMARGEHHVTVSASDEAILVVEALQDVTGQGPCLEAYRTGRVVLEPDLAEEGMRRWPDFAARAVEAGVRAAFSFPLGVDELRIGALDLYRDRPGPLAAPHIADAVVLAEVTRQTILDVQALAPPGALLYQAPNVDSSRAVLDQATGMTAVHLHVNVEEAFTLLRAYADTHDRTLGAVAGDVVSKRLRIG
ncbi:MAG: GAF and ANTAR domain-containing protein [Egibacteraceae bacterium]